MTRCPRCRSRLIRNHNRLECLAHGEQYSPVEAWERIAAADVGGVRYSREGEVSSPEWTPAERRAWERAEAGEDVPEEVQLEMPTVGEKFAERNAAIRQRRAEGVSASKLSVEFGIEVRTVYHVLKAQEVRESA